MTPRADDVAAARVAVHGPEYPERCPQRVAAVCAVCRRVATALAATRADRRVDCGCGKDTADVKYAKCYACRQAEEDRVEATRAAERARCAALAQAVHDTQHTLGHSGTCDAEVIAAAIEEG